MFGDESQLQLGAAQESNYQPQAISPGWVLELTGLSFLSLPFLLFCHQTASRDQREKQGNSKFCRMHGEDGWTLWSLVIMGL